MIAATEIKQMNPEIIISPRISFVALLRLVMKFILSRYTIRKQANPIISQTIKNLVPDPTAATMSPYIINMKPSMNYSQPTFIPRRMEFLC